MCCEWGTSWCRSGLNDELAFVAPAKAPTSGRKSAALAKRLKRAAPARLPRLGDSCLSS